MLRVAAFTGGRRVPSARFRVHQHRARLAQYGIELVLFPARLGSYPPVSRALRPLWLGATLAQRMPAVVRSHGFDVTLLQREMVSTLVTLEGFTGRPRVFDVDDALWMLRGGEFAGSIAGRCDTVVCGNDYLADYFVRYNPDVSVIPTAVDAERFTPSATDRDAGPPVVGWIGTSSGHKYLYEIEDALVRVLRSRRDAVLRVVSNRAPRFARVPPTQFEYVPWQAEQEAEVIRGMTVGIMPLRDTPWERGKCSYKMLLYMACGIPVVVSPVGLNGQLLERGTIGYSAGTGEEWSERILALLGDLNRARTMGRAGREVVMESFTAEKVGRQLAGVLASVAGGVADSSVSGLSPSRPEVTPSPSPADHGLT